MILHFLKALLLTMAAGTPVWAQLQFIPVTPCRVADTRNAAGPFGGPAIAGGYSRSFTVPQSVCGIPATAQAYSLNVTVVPQGRLSYLTLWPTGQSQAQVSTLNSWGGDVVANAAIVPAGTGGAVSVYVSDTTDVILDINGYFAASSGGNAFSFYPATPCRVADTRGATGQFGGPSMYGAQSRDFPIPLGGCGIPAWAGGYSLNVTVVPPGYLGYLSTWPTGQAAPVASTLNSWKGKVVANAALVPGGTNESISVYVSNPTNVILDINGYFGQPGHAGALAFYPVAPCRVADTRNAISVFGGPEMAAATTRSFPIPANACGIPAAASAYSVNVTVVPDGRLSYLSAWPFGSAPPNVSTLNSWDGSVVANAAIVPAGAGGGVSVYATDPTQVILDINGYFAASGALGNGSPDGYTVTGMVSGLSGGASVVLLNNGADALTVSANGSFTFPTALASGASYAVTVGTQPGGESCQVANGGPGAITADVINVVVTCGTTGPIVPPASSVVERALAQTGLSIALATNVLESEMLVLLGAGGDGSVCLPAPDGTWSLSGSASNETSTPTGILYYDTKCKQPYIVGDVTGATELGHDYDMIYETYTYYGLDGTILGTMPLNVNDDAAANIVGGTGVFTPASGLRTPVQFGLYLLDSGAGAGAVAQDFPALGIAIGAVTNLNLTIHQDADGKPTNLTFTGGGSVVTGPIGSLTVASPSETSLVIRGGTAYTSTTASGGAGSLALFPPTPTSWTLTDAAHDAQFQISVIDNATRNSNLTIAEVSTGKTLATGAVDRSGTGTITYSDGTTAAITSWTLAD